MNLENVQVGDTLVLNCRRLADSRIISVDRLTNTQIIFGENRFRKSDGGSVGRSTRDTISVAIPQDGEIEKIREARLHQKLIYEINGRCQIGKLSNMSPEQLKQLNVLLNTP